MQVFQFVILFVYFHRPVGNFKERKIATRQKPLYTNSYLQANDGELLCTIDMKKAMWYVNKNLGEIVNEDPFTVRLKFEVNLLFYT